MKQKNKKKIVSIEWLDSKGVINHWEHVEEIKSLKPSRCVSVGFLIEDKVSYKTIAQSIGNGQLLGRMTIPTCSITRISEI